jgi:hypothetical protein
MLCGDETAKPEFYGFRLSPTRKTHKNSKEKDTGEKNFGFHSYFFHD